MIIIMLGAPATGKGTVASILSESFSIPQISTGDMFREQIKQGTELGKLADSYMSKGNLVPDEVTIKIIEEGLQQNDTKNGAILDGFPRTIKQAEELDKILTSHNKQVDLVIDLVSSEEEIIERMANRRVCSNQNCKAVFNTVLNPPKQEGICDKCGSDLIKRKDDNVETIKNRLSTYEQNTSPLVDYYKQKGILRVEEVSQKKGRMGIDVAKDIERTCKW